MTRIGALFNPYSHSPDEFRDAVLAAESAGLRGFYRAAAEVDRLVRTAS